MLFDSSFIKEGEIENVLVSPYRVLIEISSRIAVYLFLMIFQLTPLFFNSFNKYFIHSGFFPIYSGGEIPLCEYNPSAIILNAIEAV